MKNLMFIIFLLQCLGNVVLGEERTYEIRAPSDKLSDNATEIEFKGSKYIVESMPIITFRKSDLTVTKSDEFMALEIPKAVSDRINANDFVFVFVKNSALSKLKIISKIEDKMAIPKSLLLGE